MARAGEIPADPSDTEQSQLLNRVRWLSDAGRTQLATEGRLIRLRARQAIYSERSTADRVFFLLAGIAKIYYTHRKARILVGHLGPAAADRDSREARGRAGELIAVPIGRSRALAKFPSERGAS
jgi:hypothetical protein